MTRLLAFLLFPLAACAGGDPAKDDSADADTDTDVDGDTDADSDSDTDADAPLPDCGPYSGVGQPGRSWSFEYINYDGMTWTFSETIASVDASTGAIHLDYASAYAYDDPSYATYNASSTGTIDWQCDAVGLQLIGSTTNWVVADGTTSSDVWAYDPPTVLVPYDPTVASTFTVAGVHNGIAFATTGDSGPNGPSTAQTDMGDIANFSIVVHSGTRLLYRGMTTDMGLILEQDASAAPYPQAQITAFTL